MKKIKEHNDLEAQVKNLRIENNKLNNELDFTEEAMQNIQSVGQYIGEVLKKLDDEKFIVKTSHGPR